MNTSRKTWIIRGGIAFGVLVLLSCIGIPILDFVVSTTITFGDSILFGWVRFLQRVLPAVRFDLSGVMLGVVAALLLVIVLHFQIRKVRNSSERKWSLRGTLAIVVAGLGSCVAGICLVGLIHEMLWMARSEKPIMHWGTMRRAARKVQSLSQIRNIAVGLHIYESNLETLPDGGTFGPNGKGYHGWSTVLLPYLDHSTLYRQIDFHRPWDDPANYVVFATRMRDFEYPGERVLAPGGYATTVYSSNQLVIGPGFGMSSSAITDGTSTTLLLGEAKGAFRPWGHPLNFRDAQLGINKVPEGFGSPWVGGANFIMSDGSGRFLNESIDPRVLRALATPNADDPVD
jgi:hypothetical protein